MFQKINTQNLDETSNESQQSLEKYLNHLEGFFFDLNFNHITKEFNFPYVSHNAMELYDLNVPDLLKDGRSAYVSIHPEDQKLLRSKGRKSFEELTPLKLECRYTLKSGRSGWIKILATPERSSEFSTNWIGHVSDITDVKATEEEYAIMKERYEFAIKGSDLGLWDWDIEKGSVFYSDKSLSLLEKTRESIDPHEDTWNNQVHPDDKEMYYKDIEDHFKGEVPYYFNEHRVFTTSGSYKWIQDRGKVVKWDDSGNPMRVIGTHTDVTESKHREQLILEKNKLIESHNSRLKNFALIVSHNLITHAGNLKNILQLMDMAESQEEKIELSNYLNDVSAGLSNTISNLNEIATSNRNLEETPKLLFLNDYVNDALNNLKTQIKEKDVVVVNDIPDDIQINYNAAYLESILFNLISNAIKYSDKERQSKVFISAEITSASDITLSVMDNGVGIDLEKYGDKLFGMYKTFHHNEDAQGLGLFMTKNQIEDMGDQISVDSKKDEGTIFRVHFINKLP